MGGWYVHASFLPELPATKTSDRQGRLGVDVNQNWVSVAHIDASGNPKRTWDIALYTTDRRSHQVKATAAEAAKEIVEYASRHRIPIVLKELDFTKKKNQLQKSRIKRRRQLSSFAYSTIQKAIRSRAARFAVEVREVNPAFTSIIGEAKYELGYGLSRHRAAAVVIARRDGGLGEALRGRNLHLPEHKRYATSLPVRNGGVHVWRDWGRFAALLKKQKQSARLTAGRTSPKERGDPGSVVVSPLPF